MKFFHAHCEVCRGSCFHAEDVIAYRIKEGRVVQVDLDGDQPWSGIRVICLTCVAQIGTWAKEETK